MRCTSLAAATLFPVSRALPCPVPATPTARRQEALFVLDTPSLKLVKMHLIETRDGHSLTPTSHGFSQPDTGGLGNMPKREGSSLLSCLFSIHQLPAGALLAAARTADRCCRLRRLFLPGARLKTFNRLRRRGQQQAQHSGEGSGKTLSFSSTSGVIAASTTSVHHPPADWILIGAQPATGPIHQPRVAFATRGS